VLSSRFVSLVSLSLLLSACAHRPPQELIDARDTYERVSQSQIAALASEQLSAAEKALVEAERAFDEHPRRHRTRDLAYVAHRKTQLAEAIAVLLAAQPAPVEPAPAPQVEEPEPSELRAAQERLAEMQQLSQLATVSEEDRGLVIRLPDQPLFGATGTTLLAEAEPQMAELAALLQDWPERHLLVEAYTDPGTGKSDSVALAQHRAESIREYLVSQGYDPEMIEAQGMGAAELQSSPGSGEELADQRRIVIVIEGEAANAL
jgi:outer membrane protein OmpA-like peptidoglycan-associated protein